MHGVGCLLHGLNSLDIDVCVFDGIHLRFQRSDVGLRGLEVLFKDLLSFEGSFRSYSYEGDITLVSKRASSRFLCLTAILEREV